MKVNEDGSIHLETHQEILEAISRKNGKSLPLVAYREMDTPVQATVYRCNDRGIQLLIRRKDQSIDLIEIDRGNIRGVDSPRFNSLCLWAGSIEMLDGENLGDTDGFQRTTYYSDLEQDQDDYLRLATLIDINRAKSKGQWP